MMLGMQRDVDENQFSRGVQYHEMLSLTLPQTKEFLLGARSKKEQLVEKDILIDALKEENRCRSGLEKVPHLSFLTMETSAVAAVLLWSFISHIKDLKTCKSRTY